MAKEDHNLTNGNGRVDCCDNVEEEDFLTIPDYHHEYKVLRQVANGAFGSVHCVQRRDTKVIHAAKYVKLVRNSSLQREVKALRELSNGSALILKFISCYKNPNGIQAVLVTEFLAGGDLCERTSAKDYNLTEQKCRTIIRQICRGIQHIHHRNYIHLDLKPFNIVFSQKKDDYDLRIIDFGLARELGEGNTSIKTGMCGTVEYMSPEVMQCDDASKASDCWGLGVIAYQLISGGVSPFFEGCRYRTMKKVVDCNYSLDTPELAKTSVEAKDFISRLIRPNPKDRLTADQALAHTWLVDDKLYLGILETLETTWMRKCLARRRWYRLLNAVRVMGCMRLGSASHSGSPGSQGIHAWVEDNSKPGIVSSSSSEDDCLIDDDDDVVVLPANNRNTSTTPGAFPSSDHPSPSMVAAVSGVAVNDIASFHGTFEKLHLIVNNGSFGTLFCVQHVLSGDVFTAKHAKTRHEESRREASILHKLRNSSSIVAFFGLYEGPNVSVIVTDFLVGGDLVERTASTDFILNENKCKAYVRQICSGLEHIHSCGVLHVDLKPFSIVFTSRDEEVAVLKITDFSLAQWLPNSSEKRIKLSEMIAGCSLEFMAPEFLECTYATTATDLWGVGVIAYMLVTGGKSPFYGGNRFRTIARILTGQYDSENNLLQASPEGVDFIRRILILDPASRMSAKTCLEHPWLSTDSSPSDHLVSTLETCWMKQLLARRRWHRWYNAVRAMQRIRKFSARKREFGLGAVRPGGLQSANGDGPVTLGSVVMATGNAWLK